jgi:hypothetical protein
MFRFIYLFIYLFSASPSLRDHDAQLRLLKRSAVPTTESPFFALHFYGYDDVPLSLPYPPSSSC